MSNDELVVKWIAAVLVDGFDDNCCCAAIRWSDDENCWVDEIWGCREILADKYWFCDERRGCDWGADD